MLRDFLTWEEMARIEVNAPDLPGISVDMGTTRIYPETEHLAHVVGYVAAPAEADVGDDPLLQLPGIRVGRAGVERYHDRILRGRAGAVQVEVNAVGRVIRELDRREGIPGQDVQISVETELQKAVLGKIEEGTTAVLLDARNGEVLAMATKPSFDPNIFNSGVSAAQWRQWTSSRSTPLINKATNGLYAPGSTFKMMVALAALDAKVCRPGDTVVLPGASRFRQQPLPLPQAQRPRRHEHAQRHHGVLRRVLLRNGAAGRHGPDRGHGQPLRPGRRSRHRTARHAARPGADAGLAPGAGQALVDRRHHRARHRAGLLSADAAVPGGHDGAAWRRGGPCSRI